MLSRGHICYFYFTSSRKFLSMLKFITKSVMRNIFVKIILFLKYRYSKRSIIPLIGFRVDDKFLFFLFLVWNLMRSLYNDKRVEEWYINFLCKVIFIFHITGDCAEEHYHHCSDLLCLSLHFNILCGTFKHKNVKVLAKNIIIVFWISSFEYNQNFLFVCCKSVFIFSL